MLNELIREKRIEQNLSQNELGRKLGYRQGQYISNIERGLCGFPLKEAKQLCKILGISKKEYIETYLSDEKKKIEGYFRG